MGNPFKKKMNRIMGKDNHNAGWKAGQVAYQKAEGDRMANEGQLSAAMKEYDDAPNTVRKTYIDAAKRAGTYGDTAEFETGLQSEVQQGARGARVGIAGRINALKKALNHTDVFKPEGYGETEGNKTTETVANAPSAPETATDSPQTALAGPETPETSADSTTNVQNLVKARTSYVPPKSNLKKMGSY